VKQAQGETCPKCGHGVLRIKNGKNGQFWACSCWPECDATYPDKKGNPDLEPPIACPVCGTGTLRKIKGSKGEFWACTNKECTETFNNYRNKPQIIKCPKCQKGYLKLRQGSKGAFWGCNRFKEGCNATFNDEKGKPKINK
jgi:ssDNA-binding Zn-finger/Zn-ribbon topoisomerase 1